MADVDILKSLREQVLDESESLVGLLRKCLALGALTGSDELRRWAKNELEGYSDDAPLPPYRSITAPLYVDSIGGNTVMKGQQINHAQIPSDLREYVPETLAFRQPLEDLVQTAASTQKSLHMGYAIFSLVASEWSKMLPMFQDVTGLYFSVTPPAVAGVVSMIRTTLVEIVIDLAKDVPLDSLPSKAKVDSVVQVHVGSNDKYEVNVGGSNSGVIGQGSDFTQSQTISLPSDLTDLIAQMRDSLRDVQDDEQRADAEQAIDDFEESVTEEDPNPEKIKRRSRALEKVATTVGSAVLSGVAKEGVAAALEHFHLLA